MSIKINRRNFLRATGFLGATAAAGYLPMAHTMAAPQTAMSAAMGNLVSPVNINLSAEAQAARFLIQATLGANYELIQEVKDKGVESWLDAYRSDGAVGPRISDPFPRTLCRCSIHL